MILAIFAGVALAWMLEPWHKIAAQNVALIGLAVLFIPGVLTFKWQDIQDRTIWGTLLLLARYGKPDGPLRVVPKLSQELLAEMIGTTRSRVNFFMNKFRKLGLIEYNGVLKVNHTLLSVVLSD